MLRLLSYIRVCLADERVDHGGVVFLARLDCGGVQSQSLTHRHWLCVQFPPVANLLRLLAATAFEFSCWALTIDLLFRRIFLALACVYWGGRRGGVGLLIIMYNSSSPVNLIPSFCYSHLCVRACVSTKCVDERMMNVHYYYYYYYYYCCCCCC